MKKFIYLAGVFVFIACMLLSLAIMIKPGAAVFYWKTTLQPEDIQHDLGYAYRYRINLPPKFFPPDKALVFEENQQLSKALSSDVIDTGKGIFVTGDSSEGGYYLFFSPIDNSDPTTNGKTYRFYSASIFFSRTASIIYFTILLFGLLQLVLFALTPAERPKLRRVSGFHQVAIDFLEHSKANLKQLYHQAQAPWRSQLAIHGRIIIITAAAAYALVFVEWLFQVTKSSFMDGMSWSEKIGIFLISGLAVALTGMLVNGVLLLAVLVLRALRIAWLPACASAVIPTLLLSSLGILWLDSFTYTVFHFGIIATSGFLRTAYGFFILLFVLGCYLWVLRKSGMIGYAPLSRFALKLLRNSMLGLLVISSVLVIFRSNSGNMDAILGLQPGFSTEKLPNIILIGSDGMSAKNMSLYGYPRETTPQIDELARESFVAENAFTNSSGTYGSIISLFTSKLPTSTRVVYSPDILQGEDAYQHLPGILNALGYTTAQIGVSHYVDATSANVLNGFDFVNQRLRREDVVIRTLRKLGLDSIAYHIRTIEERLTDRLLQAFYIENIKNPFTLVTTAPTWLDDRLRMDDLLSFLENPIEPLFVHVHLMGTHGFRFIPTKQIFSAGLEQDQDWMIDYYDDAILTYNGYIGELINALKANGQFDHTIIILYTDHAMRLESGERIPLLIHFPDDQYKGRIQTNVQNLDIAPTILDYLGLSIPDWIEGRSILELGNQKREPLFAIATDAKRIENFEAGESFENSEWLGTSNYLFSAIQVIDCQRLYRLDLLEQKWSSKDVPQYSAPCDESSLLDMEQIKQVMDNFLTQQGYDNSIVP